MYCTAPRLGFAFGRKSVLDANSWYRPISSCEAGMRLESKIEAIIARNSSSYETDRAKELFLTIPSIQRAVGSLVWLSA